MKKLNNIFAIVGSLLAIVWVLILAFIFMWVLWTNDVKTVSFAFKSWFSVMILFSLCYIGYEITKPEENEKDTEHIQNKGD